MPYFRSLLLKARSLFTGLRGRRFSVCPASHAGSQPARPHINAPARPVRSHPFGRGWGWVLVALLTSCDHFLEPDSSGSLTPEQAYNSVEDLKNNALLSVYNRIGGSNESQGLQGTGRGVFDFNSLTTDEAIMPRRGADWYDRGFWLTLHNHSWNAGTPSIKDMWEYLFGTVILCNENIERVKMYQVTHTDDVLNLYVAELRAVRALYYFYLMDLFGRVPLVTTTNVTTSEIAQAERSEVFAFIVSELQQVMPLLAEAKSNMPGEYYGRMTRPVAWFLMAKLALNAEVYTHDNWTTTPRPDGKSIMFTHKGKQLNAWEYCSVCCDSVAGYGYWLQSEFEENFQPNNEFSNENIFTIPMDPMRYANRYNYFFRSRHYSHGAALGGASENGTSATLDILKAFNYGTEEQDYRFDLTFYAGPVFENGKQVYLDNGKDPLVYYPLQIKPDLTGSPYEKTAGARLRKYAPDPNANADGRACNNDIVLFRYADVMLMKTEAMLRNGIQHQELLNLVRRRAKAHLIEATLENILNERFIELAWEGWRRNDMIRFGTFCQPYADRPQQPNEQDGHTTVFPIPGDLLKMHPSWTQNPGY